MKRSMQSNYSKSETREKRTEMSPHCSRTGYTANARKLCESIWALSVSLSTAITCVLRAIRRLALARLCVLRSTLRILSRHTATDRRIGCYSAPFYRHSHCALQQIHAYKMRKMNSMLSSSRLANLHILFSSFIVDSRHFDSPSYYFCMDLPS